MRWSDGSYLEDQDHWWLSGIHRDVFLLAKPLTFISDYHVKTPLTFAAKGSSRLASARQARYTCLHTARKQHVRQDTSCTADVSTAILPRLLPATGITTCNRKRLFAVCLIYNSRLAGCSIHRYTPRLGHLLYTSRRVTDITTPEQRTGCDGQQHDHEGCC